MLRRLIVSLIFLGFVVSAASYLTGYMTLTSDNSDKVLNPGDLVVTMSMLTDTETYHSGEYMEVRVSAACSEDLGSAIIKVYGIKDGAGRYRVNQEKIVEMSPPGNETVFLFEMPVCYGCAGISPGEYEIMAELLYSGEVIGNASKTVTLVK
jgi:hypothetical protein